MPSKPTPSFSGHTAIVTGGGSGINYIFTRLIVEAGCNVLIADRVLRPEVQEWMISVSKDGAGRVDFLQTDVTDWSQLARTFDVCEERFGRVADLVVPGAGVYEPSSNSFWNDCDVDNRYKVLDINLVHPIKMTRLAIDRMLAAKKRKDANWKGGTIVHLSSIAGQRSTMITPLYQVSKHGLNSLIRGMAPLQDAVGIRVVGVAPGTVATPLFTDHPEAAKFLDLEKDFMLPPDEVARAMIALIVDHERYESGTVLEICDVEGRWREVSLLNDPGPQGPASKTSKKGQAAEDVWRLLGVEVETNIAKPVAGNE